LAAPHCGKPQTENGVSGEVFWWCLITQVPGGNAMKQFIAKFESQMQGVLSGFDRVVFRGSLRRLTHPEGMKMYLIRKGLLCKHYLDHVKKVSQDLNDASLEPFRQLHLPIEFINNPKADKDQIARAHAAKLGIREGNVCALTALELTPTFQHEKTSMAVRYRPTLVIYHYQIDPEMGWMHARIQTWFPFYVHLCINGREWLARSMDRQNLSYFRQDNCFPWIEDIPRAQMLFDQQPQTNWTERLQPFAERLNPLHGQIFQEFDAAYYWSALQCEWASDILFKPGTLARLEPLLLHHGLLNFSSPDIMRFFGKRLSASGSVPDGFTGEFLTSLKERVAGARMKHWLQGNSLKCYGKARTPLGDDFRVETTTNNAHVLRAYRSVEGGPEDDLAWRPMRQGVCDLYSRTEVSQKINERYLDAFASVDDSTRMAELIRPLQQPCQYRNRRVRALRPFADDYLLLEAVNRGEFMINGVRNRDLQRLLWPTQTTDPKEKRRRSAAVSRKLRMLVAHGLIDKLQKTHRYQVSTSGRLAIQAILTIQQTSMAVLSKAAA